MYFEGIYKILDQFPLPNIFSLNCKSTIYDLATKLFLYTFKCILRVCTKFLTNFNHRIVFSLNERFGNKTIFIYLEMYFEGILYCIEGTEMRQLGFKVRRLLFLNRY